MKRVCISLMLIALLTAGIGAFGQESSLLAKCLGQPLAAYGKAFGETFTQTKKTPQGTVTIGDYKTGSARIEVVQKAGAKTPGTINVYYYQQPQRDWKLALKDLGLSASGVVAKEDAKHQWHLSRIKGGKLSKIEAVFIPLGDAHPDGPELHMTLR